MTKVAILSCAGTGNFGDDIMLQGNLARISNMFSKGVCYTRYIRINKNNAEEVNSHQILVVGGGELLANTDILQQIVDSEVTVPVMFTSVGVGTADDIRPYLGRFKALCWGIRSYEGAAILQGLNVRGAFFIKDPTFECSYEKKEKRNAIGLCLKNIDKDSDWVAKITEGLRGLQEKGIAVDLLALNSIPRTAITIAGEQTFISDCSDEQLAQEISSRLPVPLHIEAYKKDPVDYLGTLASYRGIVSERLHGSVAAYHTGVRFRSIPYHHKVEKFLQTFSMESMAIGRDPESICAGIEDLWRATA